MGGAKRRLPLDGLRRILVVQLGRLGDVVSSRIALHSLAAAFPSAKIEMIVPAGSVELLESEPCAAAVHGYPHRGAGGDVARFCLFLRQPRADLVVDVTGSTRSRWLSWLCGARRRAGWGRPWLYNHGTPDRRQRAASYPLEIARLIESLGIPAALDLPPLQALGRTPELLDVLQRFGGQRPVVLHPGASLPIRRWRGNGFARLAEALHAEGLPVLWVAGPAEAELARSLARESRAPAGIYLPRRVRELAAVLAEARLLVGLDSGPMHVAAALGVPVVALFGPNVPRRAAPVRGRLAFAEVDLPCRPCNQVLADCVLPEYNCMDRITVEAVLAKVHAVLVSG